MNRTKLMVFVAAFLASLLVGIFIFNRGGGFGLGNAVEVDWRLLGDLDYITGTIGSELKALDGQEVRIPGFMVPLEDNMKKVSQFLLVPSPQACIHVPPPPPNQMVLIDMAAGRETPVMFGPIWIYGRLVIKPKRHLYGESSFQMEGMRIEEYQ